MSVAKYVICLSDDYPCSLTLGKVYQAATSDKDDALHLVRLRDDTGEDYLYPSHLFGEISLPEAYQEILSRKSKQYC